MDLNVLRSNPAQTMVVISATANPPPPNELVVTRDESGRMHFILNTTAHGLSTVVSIFGHPLSWPRTIRAINGVYVAGMEHDEVLDILKVAPGTTRWLFEPEPPTVTLTVRRDAAWMWGINVVTGVTDLTGDTKCHWLRYLDGNVMHDNVRIRKVHNMYPTGWTA